MKEGMSYLIFAAKGMLLPAVNHGRWLSLELPSKGCLSLR
jgi:hypothetical protein